MAEVTRRIGLSLGADICWPICYEEILKRLELSLSIGKDRIGFEAERVAIEPYSLRQPCRYDLVIDRLTHWYHPRREWIKKSVLMDDLYVFNNTWSLQSNEKHTSYAAMMALKLPIPDTWMVPPKEYEPKDDLQTTLERYAKLFDLGEIGRNLGYPMYMKPFDGGGWVGVSRIDDEEALKAAYEKSGRHVMHLQEAVHPHDLFVRCVGLGPQIRFIKYDPSAPLHDRYMMDVDFLTPKEADHLRKLTLTINTFFGWDFNSCEALRQGSEWIPIDFANACPDSQVTSLHYHFPWLIKANLQWSLFCAATQRKMRRNLDWEPYYAVSREDMTLEERLNAYAAIADERLETDRFDEFCADHLPHLDEVVSEFFADDIARDAVRQKTAALYPEHEVDAFTDLFWDRIQHWRDADIKAREAAPKLAAAISIETPAAAAPRKASKKATTRKKSGRAKTVAKARTTTRKKRS